MPAWIHSRAQHLLAKNPSMSKSQAFAIATQQSHAAGKTPKGYGTKEGKQEAKAKYDKPKKEYVKTPNPGKLETPKLAADILTGGKADKKTDSDFNSKQLAKGRKVEREHTTSPQLADEIARDHLSEIPDYYTRLAKMEAGAEKVAHDIMMNAFFEELELIKQAGLWSDMMSRVAGKAARAAPAMGGSAQAQGIAKQMAKGRNYGGAAVDPFVKMRQAAGGMR